MTYRHPATRPITLVPFTRRGIARSDEFPDGASGPMPPPLCHPERSDGPLRRSELSTHSHATPPVRCPLLNVIPSLSRDPCNIARRGALFRADAAAGMSIAAGSLSLTYPMSSARMSATTSTLSRPSRYCAASCLLILRKIVPSESSPASMCVNPTPDSVRYAMKPSSCSRR